MVQPKRGGHAAGGDLRQRQAEKYAPAQHQVRAHERANQSEYGAAQQRRKQQKRRTENFHKAYHGCCATDPSSHATLPPSTRKIFVGHAAHHAQIVARKEDRFAFVTIELEQKIADRLLRLRVDPGQGFVENQYLRADHERPGDQHALALPA